MFKYNRGFLKHRFSMECGFIERISFAKGFKFFDVVNIDKEEDYNFLFQLI